MAEHPRNTVDTMRLGAICALLVVVLFSCQNQAGGKRPAAVADSSSKSDGTHFPAVLHGVWGHRDYLLDVLQTKSPAHSFSKLAEISALYIDLATVRGDSVEVGMSLNEHEGGLLIMYAQRGQQPNSFKARDLSFEGPGEESNGEIDSYEIGYTIADGDTLLVLYRYNPANALVMKQEYARVGRDLEHFICRHLIAGEYMATAVSSGDTMTITFGEDGLFSGLPSFSTYYVCTDFVLATIAADEKADEERVDYLCLDLQTPRQRCLAYKIEGDTLNLYEAIDTEWAVSRGALLYRLVRKK